MEVKYKNEAFLVVGEYVCSCDGSIGIYFVFAFCEVVQRKQKRVVCLMTNQWSLYYPAFANGFERSTP